MSEVIYYLIMAMALGWAISHTKPRKDDDRW